MVHRSHLLKTVAIVVAATFAGVSPARADWKLASADAPVAVIRGTTITAAHAGDTLRDGDLLESHAGVVHLQDARGTLVALGPDTRAMLADDAHLALLHGWLKMAVASCAAGPCPAPRVDTQRGSLEIGAHAAAIIAAPADADSIDMFSESGTQTFASKPPATIANGRFATVDHRGHPQAAARPSETFLASMPVAFRDALQPLSTIKPSQASAQSARAVNYADVAPWLESALPQRKSFPTRFRPRLTDAAFRGDIGAHLKALPDWRALLYPPARVHRARYF
jgi:hypothetical protein